MSALNNSKPGDAVYDPFSGSGTTLIACETEGRVCYAMEIDAEYCDVCSLGDRGHVRAW
jgi:DNA modification methylase